jgi:hypothetical protein
MLTIALRAFSLTSEASAVACNRRSVGALTETVLEPARMHACLVACRLR